MERSIAELAKVPAIRRSGYRRLPIGELPLDKLPQAEQDSRQRRNPRKRIRDLDPAERPRERLAALGGAGLSDAELVAVLLRSGRPGQSALEMGRQLLAEAGGLSGLVGARPAALQRPGLGIAKASTLVAALEIGKRLAQQALPRRRIADRPEELARYLYLRYGGTAQEVIGAVYVNRRHRLVAERELFRGTAERAVVEPRLILREGLMCGAHALLLFHTHPSGDPTPSEEDFRFTHRLARSCALIGLQLLDHLVLGSQLSWVSLRREQPW